MRDNWAGFASAVRHYGVQGRVIGIAVILIGSGAILSVLGVPPSIVLATLLAFLLGFVLVLTAGAPRQNMNNRAAFVPQDATDPVPEPATQRRIEAAVQEMFDRLPVAVVWIDGTGRVTQSNAAARGLLALDETDAPKFENLIEGLGRSVSDWLQVARENPDLVKPEMVQARRRPGEAVLQVSLMRPTVPSDNALVAVLSDATKIKTLEAQFIQSQKMQAIGQLAGGVAHDFNNLLTAISGYCDLLLLRHDKNDPDYSDLVQINQNANRAASLVAHLLAFSRKQTLTPKALSVNDTVSEMSHLLSRLLGEKVTLTADYGRDLPQAYVDPRQLEQVIMNLVLNARDAMPDGGEVRLSTSVEVFERNIRKDGAVVPRGKYIQLKVMDSGHGIAPENIDKIFEPFYSTKEEGKGTGLGLSMVYGIVKQTGGFIFCDSTPGEGTEFSILLPALEAKQVKADAPRAPKSTATELGGLTILLVEDEAPVRSFAARALKMHGVKVIEADCAEAALEIVRDRDDHIDVVVSDVVMPGMDGPTWFKKAQELRAGMKVIFVSGYAEESFSAEYPDIEGAQFLPKPFTLRELVEKVRCLVA